jgi:hypothetical protein
MMEQPQIKVVIDAQGQVKIEVMGVAGPGCLKLTRDLEMALSGGLDSRLEREFKPEFGFTSETTTLETDQPGQHQTEGHPHGF